ncbi:Adenylate cyclase [Fulvivirga imtechensis AK7]|uniref:Adenylate cyclase n=1 Tax=Fulvivirga imtechensis AK7 TaxID=1237149 RepID=L8JQ38_9BACT|nr:adenylate/guanylate cyclase domain-containing protein [Fulvivirga imtechensis]ELR69497.1 Adenylate cyclase [Fulvivirga imtechensis AK7]
MKQLPLFNNSLSQSLQMDLKRKLRRSRKTRPVDTLQRNLWKQETEEEKEMALFFLDLRNFTPFVESHVAADVIYVVRKLFSTFQNIIRINHGQIIETSGDGFYAAFGFDRRIEEAVNSAVKAGNSILDTLELLNERSFEKKLNHKIEAGIGLHAGKVATGTILLNGKDHLIVMGYPVNIAARLEAATKELNNNFIVSSTVFDLLKSPPEESAMAEVKLKGVANPFKLHLIGKSYDQS